MQECSFWENPVCDLWNCCCKHQCRTVLHSRWTLACACELLLVLTMQLTARHEIEVSGRVQQ